MGTVFSGQQLSSIVLGLEKGDIPVKYAYMTEKGSQARSTLERLRTKGNQSFADTILLYQSIELYLQELGNPNEIAIFDFGCGTGETVKPTLEKLSTMNIGVKYHAFDISQNIIDLCKQTIVSLQDIHFDHTIIDFEISNLVNQLHTIRSQYNNIPVLGLLLGNTVGNFNSMERILSNILEAFRLQDKLVIGIERADIKNRRWYDNMMDAYTSQEVVTISTASLAELGFNLTQGVYTPIFNEKNNVLECFFLFKEDVEITINNTRLTFKKGERIRIVQSKKIDESFFSKLLLDLDLRIVNIRTNVLNSYLQALVSSKRI